MIRIMKSKISVLATLLCLCGAVAAHASDCTGDGCNIEPINLGVVREPTDLGGGYGFIAEYAVAETPAIAMPAVAVQPAPVMYQMVAPVTPRPIAVVPVSRDALGTPWDGVHGTFRQRKYDKTVDWRTGVPIWDDSISHYRDKDFSDWYDEMDIRYVAEDVPETDDGDCSASQQVEALLAPRRPSSDLWLNNPEKYQAQDMGCAVRDAFNVTVTENLAVIENPDGCPFEKPHECEIWRRKPMVRETVAPRSKKIRATNVDAFIIQAKCNPTITANEPVAAPLLDRYKMLMKSAQACCTDGMVYALKNAGATDGLIYKFMSDDANFYNLGARCLMTTDAEFDTKYPNTATAAVAADVRNGCLCRGRQWFAAMLAPFEEAWRAAPQFAESKFNYTYTDGLQRQITVSVNNDVKNVLNQLAQCP